jgi:nitrogen fixation NifU-like protein
MELVERWSRWISSTRHFTNPSLMIDDLQKRIAEAIRNPQNLGELADADAVGTVGNSDCGEMLRMWVKFKEEKGRKVIDRATFQSFGCETAIAVASLATELIRGKTAEEALALKTEELAGELGPLPPMKIHCAQLVEGALRSALEPEQPADTPPKKGDGIPTQPAAGSNLLNSFTKGKPGKITFLPEPEEPQP